MNNKSDILKIKKFMSFTLRHKPFFYKIKLDGDGNASTDSLVTAIKNTLKIEVQKSDLVEIAKNLSGGIFKVSKDGSLIAARHGHTFIYNMTVPDGYAECDQKDIPNQLYAIINKIDFYSYMNSDIIPLSNKKIKLYAAEPKAVDDSVVIKVVTNKLDPKKSQVYYNKEDGSYFTKFLTKNSVVINV